MTGREFKTVAQKLRAFNYVAQNNNDAQKIGDIYTSPNAPDFRIVITGEIIRIQALTDGEWQTRFTDNTEQFPTRGHNATISAAFPEAVAS